MIHLWGQRGSHPEITRQREHQQAWDVPFAAHSILFHKAYVNVGRDISDGKYDLLGLELLRQKRVRLALVVEGYLSKQ